MPIQQTGNLPWRRTPWCNSDPQVRTVEASDEDPCPTPEQPLDDVLPCDGVCGCREGAEAGVGEMFRKFGEATVVRPEVVAPLGDAVRLVDGKSRRTVTGQALQYVRLHEAFRRDVEQAQSTVAHTAVCLGGVRPRRRRIKRAGRHTVEAQRGYLITHQGDERRDHHGQGFGCESGKLVAHRLTRAGWHHRQHILTRQQCLDDIRLSGPEPVVAEGAFQMREGNVKSRQSYCSNWLRLRNA